MILCPVCSGSHLAARHDAADVLAAVVIAAAVRVLGGRRTALGELVVVSIAMQRCLKGQAAAAAFPRIRT